MHVDGQRGKSPIVPVCRVKVKDMTILKKLWDSVFLRIAAILLARSPNVVQIKESGSSRPSLTQHPDVPASCFLP